jgi:hypothetical protein
MPVKLIVAGDHQHVVPFFHPVVGTFLFYGSERTRPIPTKKVKSPLHFPMRSLIAEEV